MDMYVGVDNVMQTPSVEGLGTGLLSTQLWIWFLASWKPLHCVCFCVVGGGWYKGHSYIRALGTGVLSTPLSIWFLVFESIKNLKMTATFRGWNRVVIRANVR